MTNSITVTNRVDLNSNGSRSGLAFSVHLITWGMGENDPWFTPDEEYCTYYPANGNMVPTMKVGSTDIETDLTSDENGKRIYFVLTGTNGFEYWRTAETIKIGNISGKNRSFVIYANTESVETDSTGSDLSPARVVFVEKTSDGKRSIEKNIPVERVK